MWHINVPWCNIARIFLVGTVSGFGHPPCPLVLCCLHNCRTLYFSLSISRSLSYSPFLPLSLTLLCLPLCWPTYDKFAGDHQRYKQSYFALKLPFFFFLLCWRRHFWLYFLAISFAALRSQLTAQDCRGQAGYKYAKERGGLRGESERGQRLSCQPAAAVVESDVDTVSSVS